MKIKKLLSVIAVISLFSVVQLGIGQTFPVNNLTASGTISAAGSVTAPSFIGNASTATTAGTVTAAAQPAVTSVGATLSIGVPASQNGLMFEPWLSGGGEMMLYSNNVTPSLTNYTMGIASNGTALMAPSGSLTLGAAGSTTVSIGNNTAGIAVYGPTILSGSVSVTGSLSATTPIGLSSGGTGVTGFLQSGTGAVSRSWTTKNQDIVNAKDFGAICNGSGDDTASIQSALNSGAGVVNLPSGACIITSTLHLDISGQTLKGQGETSTILWLESATLDGIWVGNGTNNPNNAGVSNLSITGAIPRTSGSAIKLINGHKNFISHVSLLNNMFWGFDIEGGAQQFEYKINDFEINAGTIGIVIGATAGLLPQDIWIHNGVIASQTVSAMSIYNASGLYVSDIDAIGNNSGLITNPGSGQIVLAAYFKHVLMDTSANNGWYIITSGGRVEGITIDASWSSTSGTGLSGTGLEEGFYINQASGIINGVTISNSQITHNSGAGIYAVSGKNIQILGNQIFENSQQGSAARSGIEVSAGVNNFIVSGNVSGDGGVFVGSNFQAYGLSIATTSSTYSVTDNIFTGNVTGAMLDGGNSTKSVIGNLGYLVGTNSGSLSIGNGVSQAAPSATLIAPTATAQIGGYGGNSLSFGQYSNGISWMQSSYLNPSTQTYPISMQPLGGSVGIGTGGSTPSSTLQVVGTITSSGLINNGVAVYGALTGTTGSIGGSALLVGACASGTVAVTGATTSMTVSASPNTYPGDGFYQKEYVSSAGTVTVKVCASVAGTPTTSTYNVRAIQ